MTRRLLRRSRARDRFFTMEGRNVIMRTQFEISGGRRDAGERWEPNSRSFVAFVGCIFERCGAPSREG